jgi:putative salt-induced outer membrane protein YdiY
MALVSIAPVDIGSKPGFSGNVSGSLSSKSGNTDKKEVVLGMRVQYDQGSDYLAWGTFTYNYGESAGTKNEDKLYGHLRYIHALGDGGEWCAELFAQSARDEFKDINERSLAGAGVRWRFFNSDEWGKGYAGIGGFAEKIEYAHPLINPSERNQRLNSYAAYTKTFHAGQKLSYIGYYQPQFADNADYVTLQTGELIVPVYGKLSLSLLAKYLYDSRPPVGVEKKDTVYLTNLVWEF